MDILEIAMIVEAGISLIGFILSFVAIKRGKSTTAVSIQEIAEKAENIAQAYFERQCKKKGLDPTQLQKEDNHNGESTSNQK